MAQHDIKSANQTYAGFTTMAKIGAVICAGVVALVLVLIS